MKHQHSDINVNIQIPTTDILTVLNQVSDLAVYIICASTASHILKSFFKTN